jgi:uncharacterized protein
MKQGIRKQLTIRYNNITNTIPYILFSGDKPGPKLFISGGMHGNEVNGIYYVNELIKYFETIDITESLNGEIYLIPILNPSGFQQRSRYIAEDGKDLNRSFGINTPTNYSQYHAKVLWDEIFSKCDYGIDFHDSGSGSILLPHTRIDKNSSNKSLSRKIGQLFGTEIILERDGRSGMLAIELYKQLKKIVLTVEIGGGQIIYDQYRDLVFNGVKNVLSLLQMKNYEIIIPKHQYTLLYRFGIKSQEAGLIRFDIELGEKVKEGQKIGEIYNPITMNTYDLISPFTGWVFSQLYTNQIKKNQKFISILETDKCIEGICYLDQFIPMPKLDISQIKL